MKTKPEYRRPLTLDFETKAIEKRPEFPPEPVGFAVTHDNRSRQYVSWGHRTGNTHTKDEAVAMLRKMWDRVNDSPICFHNAKFDLAVATEKLGLPMLLPHQFDDTMLQAFLVDPFATSLGLKPLAEKYLDMPPEEQDAVRDYIMANWKELGLKRKPGSKQWGAYMWLVPPHILGPYATGDTDRTQKLFGYFHHTIRDMGMDAAYMREKRLLPILLRTEQRGIHVNRGFMELDYLQSMDNLEQIDQQLCLRLGDINPGSGEELADALEAKGIVHPDQWAMTLKGVRKTGYNELRKLVPTDLADLFELRGRLSTITGTFMKPWLDMSESTDRIYTDWQQVRNGEGKMFGARTGRLSSTPNFQNVPKQPWTVGDEVLPYMRRYIIPDEGQILIDRDYSQQELRLLAHYIGGDLIDLYRADVNFDLHAYAQLMINNMLHANYERKPIKNTAFAILYGMSNGSLGDMLGTDKKQASILKNAYFKTMPELKALTNVLKKRAAAGQPFRTWGGRYYWCEEPKIVNGRRMTFEYKMLNQLIQGSAADVTKEAVIRMDEICNSELLLTVHDQILRQCSADQLTTEMRYMKEAMESIECDVKMTSDGEYSVESWGDLIKYDDPGKEYRGASVPVRETEGADADQDDDHGQAGNTGPADPGPQRPAYLH